MKKQTFRQTIALVFAILITFSLAHAQEPKIVTDFYLAMPNDNYSHPYGREIKGKAAITKYRKSLIKIEDIKNGYLKIEPNEEEGWSEIALFKKTDGSYLVAHSQVGCGPACGGGTEFLTYAGGKWTDVTKQFFPALTKEQKAAQDCLFELPRAGRILTMSCGNTEDDTEEGKVFHFEWNGAKFINK
ncbi:MAG: hypothetical protein ABI954_15845 [Pyrinomonadaceae bacterium]